VPDVAPVLMFEFDFVGKSVQRSIGDRNVALSQIDEDLRLMNVARMLHGYPDVVRVHETKMSRRRLGTEIAGFAIFRDNRPS